jgi:cytochrome c553
MLPARCVIRRGLVPVLLIAFSGMFVASGQPPVASHMREHFNAVEEVQVAVMRGDLEAAQTAARWIVGHDQAAGLPPKSDSQVAAMRSAAQRVVDARDLRMAANAAAQMASTCGTCHRSHGAAPNLPAPEKPSAGKGLNAHMLAHKEAIDYLYRGLVAPSDALWKKGSELLKGAPLTKEDLPDDPALTDEIRKYETTVHQYARVAATDKTMARANVYGELIASCASCHSLHGRVWGPGQPKER